MVMNERRQSMWQPNRFRSSMPYGGKYCSQCMASVNLGTSSVGTIMSRISHCFLPPDLATAFVFLPLNLPVGGTVAPSAGVLALVAAAACSSSSVGKTGGLPYWSISRLSLFAAAWIGMPVQWNAKGKSALAPLRRRYRTANSALVTVKACPR